MLDIVQRYAPVVNEILKDPPKDKQILEIGGTGEGLGWYLPNYQIIDCDLEFVDKILPNTKPVKASGEKIPLPDNSAEIVVSVDTLEHLPTKKKQAKMIKEMLRVARKKVFLGVPTGEKSWQTVKEFAKMFYHKHPGQYYQYLEEHLEYGHPTKKEIISMISNSGYQTTIRTKNNTNNRLWLVYQKIFLEIPRLYHILRYRRFWYLILRPVFPFFNFGFTMRTIFFVEKV